MSDTILQVFVFREGEYVGSEIFAAGEVMIGRGDDADLMLDDSAIAPAQAVLRYDGRQATLLDLTRGDSTKINRTAIRHSYVTQRDEIHLGPFTLKLKFQNRSGLPSRSRSVPSPPPPNTGPAEPRTEILDTRRASEPAAAVPGQTTAQAKIPTQLVRSRESDRTRVRDEGVQRGGEREHNSTAGFEVSSGDVIGTRADQTEAFLSAPGFNAGAGSDRFDPPAPSGDLHPPATALEPSSLEVMLDSAFLPADQAEDRVPSPPITDADPEPNGHRAATATPSRPNGRGPALAPAARPDAPADLLAVPPPPSAPVLPAAPSLSAPSAPAENVGPTPIARLFNRNGKAPPVQDAAASASPLRIPGSEPEPVYEELDEEEREADERPGFTLVTQMTTPPANERTEHLTAVEVIAYQGQDLQSAHVLTRPGDQYVLGRSYRGRPIPSADARGLRLVKMTGPGTVEIEFASQARGRIRKQGRTADLESLKRPEHAAGRKADRYRVALKTGMDASVQLGATRFHVRFVRAPATVPPEERGRVDPFFPRAFGGAIAAHLIFGILLVLLGPQTTFSAVGNEAYAEIREQAPRDVEIKPEPPPPPPEPEPEPEPQPKSPPPPAPPKKRAKKVRRPKRRSRPEPTKGATQQPLKTAGVLNALGKLNLRAPGRRSMTAAMSNIDAVKAPGGSNYRVGALVGKTPDSDVQVGGGGGGKLLTRGSASLLKSGFGKLAGRRSGKVRGRVRRVSARRLKAKGTISREAIARVINKNLGEVQYCYERALLKKPGLKGKLVLEWRISTSGRVSRVRQKLSTIQSAEVATCIIKKLGKWRFPKPQGGIVVVSYPFIFSSVGF